VGSLSTLFCAVERYFCIHPRSPEHNDLFSFCTPRAIHSKPSQDLKASGAGIRSSEPPHEHSYRHALESLASAGPSAEEMAKRIFNTK
jgi:hypothetical protein